MSFADRRNLARDVYRWWKLKLTTTSRLLVGPQCLVPVYTRQRRWEIWQAPWPSLRVAPRSCLTSWPEERRFDECQFNGGERWVWRFWLERGVEWPEELEL